MKTTTGLQDVLSDSVVADVSIMDIPQGTSKAHCKDLDTFVTPVYDTKGIDGKVQKYRIYIILGVKFCL